MTDDSYNLVCNSCNSTKIHKISSDNVEILMDLEAGFCKFSAKCPVCGHLIERDIKYKRLDYDIPTTSIDTLIVNND